MHHIDASFFDRQCAAALRFAAECDRLELTPLGEAPVRRYLARFACATLVRGADGAVTTAQGFAVGLTLPAYYLWQVSPLEVASWLGPPTVFLPNVAAPLMCVGAIAPGTGLVELLLQVHAIGTGANVTMSEDNALCPEACAWARRHPERFPADGRPLRRQALAFAVEVRS
jgi:hypothetical protein